MKVFLNSHGKTPKLQDLKAINRQVSKVFPFVSPTYVTRANREIAHDENTMQFLRAKHRLIQEAKAKREKLAQNPVEYYKTIVQDTNNIQATSCTEIVGITYVTYKYNGVPNSKLVGMRTNNGRVIDHVAVLTEGKKENYITDLWLGECASESEMKVLYNTKHASVFEMVQNEPFSFVEVNAPVLNDNDIQYFANLVPKIPHKPSLFKVLSQFVTSIMW